jgi:hypothetical protein
MQRVQNPKSLGSSVVIAILFMGCPSVVAVAKTYRGNQHSDTAEGPQQLDSLQIAPTWAGLRTTQELSTIVSKQSDQNPSWRKSQVHMSEGDLTDFDKLGAPHEAHRT